MDNIFVIAIALIIFIIVAMMVALIKGGTAQKERNLAVIKGRTGGVQEKSGDKESEQNKRRDEISRKLKEKSAKDKEGKKATIPALIQQAGMSMSVKQFWLMSVAFSVGSIVLAKFFDMSTFVVVMAAIIGFFGLPRMFIKRKIKKRQKKFLKDFADALEAMVRLLKAGMPVTEAIHMASREFEGPVGEEMAQIYDAQKIGVPLAEATLDAAHRMSITEMHMFATGIAIQAQTGASLSEVLMNLAGVIRARYALKRKVQALSSEAKASAGIIGSLPFLIGTGMYFINPEQIGLLFSTSLGNILLGVAFGMMATGVLIMKAMINFKV